MYRVILPFPERFDGGYKYEIGDSYPREGFSPPADRVQELLDGTNRAKKVYLEAVEERAAATDEASRGKPRNRKKKE